MVWWCGARVTMRMVLILLDSWDAITDVSDTSESNISIVLKIDSK